MSKVVKTGDFSTKYYYALCENGDYYLLGKAKVPDATTLKGLDLPELRSREDHDINVISFAITPVKCMLYILFCAVLSVFLNRISIYWIVLLWSMNLHEFTHICVASAAQHERLLFGIKIRYGIFFMFYISNKTIYEQSRLRRVRYYGAGIMTNLAISILCSCALLTPIRSVCSPVLQSIVQVNVALFVVNLYPFLFTDGFNILQELLGIYNLRSQVMDNFWKPSRLIHGNRVVLLYYVFIVISWAVVVWKIVTLILRFI